MKKQDDLGASENWPYASLAAMAGVSRNIPPYRGGDLGCGGASRERVLRGPRCNHHPSGHPDHHTAVTVVTQG
jgi:hypothetical protein